MINSSVKSVRFKTNLRKFFKIILKSEVKFFLKRNQVEVTEIIGWSGGYISREALYEILSPRYNTKRNILTIQRDIDLPLEVIGFKYIPKYNFLIPFLMIYLFFKILFSKRNKLKLILDFNSSDIATIKYWESIFNSRTKTKLFLNTKPGFENIINVSLKGIKNKCYVVANMDNKNIRQQVIGIKDHKVFFGSNLRSDLIWEKNDNVCIIRYKDDEISYKNQLPDHALNPIAGAITASIVSGSSIHNSVEKLKNFKMPSEKINTELYKFYD